MKTINFTSLPAEKRREATTRVCAMLDSKARDTGRVCIESATDVAPRCQYQMTRQGGIWQIQLPTDLRILR